MIPELVYTGSCRMCFCHKSYNLFALAARAGLGAFDAFFTSLLATNSPVFKIVPLTTITMRYYFQNCCGFKVPNISYLSML